MRMMEKRRKSEKGVFSKVWRKEGEAGIQKVENGGKGEDHFLALCRG